MKKIVVFVLAAIMLFGAVAVPVSAATADDIITELSKSPAFHYIEKDIKNLARTYTFTPEEYDALLDIARELNVLVPKDFGPSAHEYPAGVGEKILELAKKACDIIGFTYTISYKTASKHEGDIIFTVFDKDGKTVYAFDGDVIEDTASSVEAVGTGETAALIVLGVLCAAGLAAGCIISGKKNKYTVR